MRPKTHCHKLEIEKYIKDKGKIIVKDKLYIPKSILSSKDKKKLKKLLNFDLFSVGCSTECPNYDDRGYEICKACDMYIAKIRFFKKTSKYYSLPYYNKKVIKILKPYLKKYGIRDKRSFVEFDKDNELEFTGSLRKETGQDIIADCMLKSKYGMLNAAVRIGKTVLAIYLITKIRQKTLILAHQEDLLKQFMDKFYQFTNLKEIQTYTGRATVCIYTDTLVKKKYKGDYDKFLEDNDVVLSTYQKFAHHLTGKDRIKRFRDKFGLIIVDEAHRVNTECFRDVVINFNAPYKIGLSATPKRTDNLHIVAEHIIGPIQVIANDYGMTCIVDAIDTGIKLAKSMKSVRNRVILLKYLAGVEKRRKMIMERIKEDIDNDRYIVIPVEHKKDLFRWLKELQKEKISCIGFYSGCNREKVLRLAREGEVRVVVGIRSMLKEGLDVPMWDTIYEIYPYSNPYGYYQEISRIRTPYEGKPTPIIRYFVDEISLSINAFKKAHKVHEERGFEFTKEYKKVLKKYENYRNYKSFQQEPVKIKTF